MINVAVGLLILLGAAIAAVAVGQLAVWIIERYTLLSAFNLYPALTLAACLTAIGILSRRSMLERGAGIALLALASMTATAIRHRNHALGAGGSLRAHELARRWIWQPRPYRQRGERVYLAAQGEVVHRRPWSPDVPYVSLEAPGQRRAPRHGSHAARLPLGEGQHVFVVRATGAGKTTTARRIVCARVLSQNSSLVILDQKGDAGDVEQMRRLAAAAGVPFVLFDSEDRATDRWQPLWGSPEMVAARATEAEDVPDGVELRWRSGCDVTTRRRR